MSYSRVNQNAEKIAASIINSIGVSEPTDNQVFNWFVQNFDYRFEINAIDLTNQDVSGMIHGNGPKGSFKILVEKSEPYERQRFSIYHELGHLLQGKEVMYGLFDGDVNNKKEEERFCNRFAAALLMPESSFRSHWKTGSPNDLIKRYSIAEHYGVSVEAVNNRARDLDLA